MNCQLLLLSKGEWAKKPPLSFTVNPTTIVEHTHNLLLLLCRDTSLNLNRTVYWLFVSSIERETENRDETRYNFSREVQNDAQEFWDFLLIKCKVEGFGLSLQRRLVFKNENDGTRSVFTKMRKRWKILFSQLLCLMLFCR